MAESVIEARRLFVVHRAATGNVVALQGLSMNAAEGELLAVVGPSGSGKSTLLRCLAGLQRPTAGELRALGIQLHDASARTLSAYRGRVAAVQQSYVRALSGDLTVEQIVALPAALRGVSGGERRRRVDELLARVGLADRAHARKAELSGGEQQRVAVCAALVSRPQLLLADEPTGELDDAAAQEVMGALHELSAAEEVTTIVATHDDRVASVADRVLTVRDGRSTAELEPRSGRRLALIDEAGLVRLDQEDLQRARLSHSPELTVAPGRIVLSSSAPPPAAPPAETKAAPRAEPADTVAQLHEVSRRYGRGSATVMAVDGATLRLGRGIFYAVAGPSGCGKTTLLHLLAGLERPSAGRIEVCTEELLELDREQLAGYRRRHVAMVPQAAALVPFLSVYENVELGLAARGVPARQRPALVRAALASVDLEELAGRRAAVLSGGERQRTALARALAATPALLLADEPTANLDQRSAIGTAELLGRAASEHGITVVCATHDPSVRDRAHRVIAMSDGRVESRAWR